MCILSRCSPWKYSSSTSLPCRAIRTPCICGAVVRIHRHVEQLWTNCSIVGAIDALRIERATGQPSSNARRRAIRVAARMSAARIELAVVAVAMEVVVAAAAGKVEGDGLVLGVPGSHADFPFLPAALADQFQLLAIDGEPLDALLRAEVELRVAQHGAQRSIGLPREQQKERERHPAAVRRRRASDRVRRASAARARAPRARSSRCHSRAWHSRSQWPRMFLPSSLPRNRPSRSGSSKVSSPAFDADRHLAPQHVGDVGGSFLLDDEGPVCVRAEAALRLPQAGQVLGHHHAEAHKNDEYGVQTLHGGLD